MPVFDIPNPRRRVRMFMKMVGRVMSIVAALCAMTAIAASSVGAENPRTTTLMTINIYQGTELEHVLAATDLPSLVTAVTADYGNVRATNFVVRAQALAGEIAAAQPTLVGLQEVATWTVNGAVSYDFLQILLDALAARGQYYAPVITRDNWSAAAPGIVDGAVKLVGLTEGTALLARSDLPTSELKWSNPQSHDFDARTVFPFLGRPFDLGGGWLSVDAKVRGKDFRFITTHMDPISPLARTAQAAQIVAEAGGDGLPLVVSGDTNSDPTSLAYHEFLDSGLTDTWAALHPQDPGLTCCHIKTGEPDADAITDPNTPLSERVDYVLTSPGITPVSETLFNTSPAEIFDGLWPTDHAAIAVTIGLDPLPQN
jgi:endonuclease/exonuclease/phosphatase family metal-dependent hydrolase